MADSTMKVNIVCAERPLWVGEAKSVTVPASEGGMGILPDHEPMMTVIDKGIVSAVDVDGNRHSFEVSDGFASFDSNSLTVAAETGDDVKKSVTQ
ncbi:F0F1 ATP synthase subunit epsilon [Bifidobacterium sp. ESL0775]|uniref:F0F1 ATP synthase subunit epsilon n=1 Tax=Bifidobacterium sp. ESL0775 TaxID=2983230 RepID=UPI0023F914C8|nr:F0F1 ATP synthase subunit epsilon [Bifidobacterium sp. ESL0775]WEV69146.1 F0F1 ATP synthase subunit epsilon [Bifidobacterium sp. ESL0775]